MNASNLHTFIANHLATALVGGQRSVPWNF